MGAKQFDYYIFIDYSVNLVGYSIIERSKLIGLLPRITRFRHFKDAHDNKQYLKNVKRTIERENILSYFLRVKIKNICKNMEVYLDILEFLKNHDNCIIFVSVDNHEFPSFRKMINIVDGNNVTIKLESELRPGTVEYKASLVLDNLLNIERLKDKV
jgi:hypothetical protein